MTIQLTAISHYFAVVLFVYYAVSFLSLILVLSFESG